MGLLSNRGSFNRGVYHFSRGEYLASIENYRKAVKRAPGDGQAWNNLGLAYYKLGKVKDAMRCLDEALMISPEDHFALTNKAALILAGGRHGEARYVIDKVLIRFPDDIHALNLKGLALMKDELYMEAHELFRRAVEIDPHYRHAARNLAKARINLASAEKLSDDDKTVVSSNPRRSVGSDDDGDDLPRPRKALPFDDGDTEEPSLLEDHDLEEDEETVEMMEYEEDLVDWEE